LGPEPPEPPSGRRAGSGLWGALRRDPVFVAGAVCLLAVVSPYFFPVFTPSALWTYASSYSVMPLILATLVALQYRLRQVESGAERRFWNLWTLAYGAWLIEHVTFLAVKPMDVLLAHRSPP